jgi:hypothetical protein
VDGVTDHELLRAKIVELRQQNSALLEKIALLEQRILQLEAMFDKNSGNSSFYYCWLLGRDYIYFVFFLDSS